jgi:carboxylesterase type B
MGDDADVRHEPVPGPGSATGSTKPSADGVVVVTINYRLGALGFLAHPALASRPGGPAGNGQWLG